MIDVIKELEKIESDAVECWKDSADFACVEGVYSDGVKTLKAALKKEANEG